MIKVFIGTDRSQWLATQVLTHSLKKTTSEEIEVIPLDKIIIPEPLDVRQSQRTGFSFARWAIPELCSYQGRAIYIDADMLVFNDIAELWNAPIDDHTIAIVDGTDAHYCSGGVKLNKNETSVMVINCEKAKWTLQGLVRGLDGHYTYHQMMSELCFIDESQIARVIPRRWNSMDFWDKTSSLVHFTNVPTQPWVSLDNPFGYIWVNYLKSMIAQNDISLEDVQGEIDKGYVRPSLIKEIKGETIVLPHNTHALADNDIAPPLQRQDAITLSTNADIATLKQLDRQKGYIPHREVMAWNVKRDKAIKAYERSLARSQGIGHYAMFEFKNIVRYALRALRS